MNHTATKGTGKLHPRRRKQLLYGTVALLTVCLLGVALAVAVRQSHIRHQMQADPEVATAWLIQVTHGPNHTLTRGSTVQRWANEHGVHALGDYQVLTGSFNGEPNGIELWFDYDSHMAVKDLECHRVGPTAFVDDLGQVYHGFLDFQGKTVGVYLPAYDRSAHRLTCTLHWMPRRPAAPFPVSTPMTFTVPLPSTRRTLPPASTLPDGPVIVTKSGITVILSDVHLSPTRLRPLYEGQRDLTFQLHVQGGQIADENVVLPAGDVRGISLTMSPNTTILQRQLRNTQGQIYNYRTYRFSSGLSSGKNVLTLGNSSSPSDSFTITDPYGVALLSEPTSVATPLTNPRKGQKATPFWVAPVNGAGRGTDCVQFHFHVQPPSRSPKAMPPELVAFDIPVRISPEPAP
ncbi:MAG: hypothetical protein JWL77_2320 [Chthonomonadaceae bacterium]|nr:hypothetical protein [Chthonomonadaceae bacterium]